MKKKIITAGVDEVGRGCLAGPVVSAAVILNEGIKIIDDKLHIPSKESINIINYNPLPAIPAKLNVGK